jgi:hypothetical protein
VGRVSPALKSFSKPDPDIPAAENRANFDGFLRRRQAS